MGIFNYLPTLIKRLKELPRLITIKEQYDLLTNAVSAGIMLFDCKNRVIFASPYTEVLTGYSPDYVLSAGRDMLEQIIVESDVEKYKRAKQIAAVGEDMLVRYQIRHQRGFNLWLETRFVPVLSEEGKVKSIMALSIDLTESMNYQKLIEQQNQDLADFAYMISHDLKAPIFTIKGMASTLLSDNLNAISQENKDYLHYILEASDRLSALIASVVEYSSISIKDIEKDSINLTYVINNVISDLQKQIKDSNAQILVDPNLPNVTGSTVRIYQIFSNIIGNAIKYCSPERAPHVSLKLSHQSNDTVTIDVSDNGLGIPSAKIKDVFRPFKRAHNNTIAGSGIGLACVKKIVEKLGGTVSVSSEEGIGSIFSITLPLASNRM